MQRGLQARVKQFVDSHFPFAMQDFQHARMHEFLDTLINGRHQEVESMLNRYVKLFMFIPPEMMVIENRHT